MPWKGFELTTFEVIGTIWSLPRWPLLMLDCSNSLVMSNQSKLCFSICWFGTKTWDATRVRYLWWSLSFKRTLAVFFKMKIFSFYIFEYILRLWFSKNDIIFEFHKMFQVIQNLVFKILYLNNDIYDSYLVLL